MTNNSKNNNNHTNYYPNSHKNENANNDFNSNNNIPSKTRNTYNLEKIYIIDNKDINILNMDDNKNKDINNNSVYEIVKYKKKDDDYNEDLNDENYEHDNNENSIKNNIDNSLINNNIINKHKKPLGIIQDFSKYKRKNAIY